MAGIARLISSVPHRWCHPHITPRSRPITMLLMTPLHGVFPVLRRRKAWHNTACVCAASWSCCQVVVARDDLVFCRWSTRRLWFNWLTCGFHERRLHVLYLKGYERVWWRLEQGCVGLMLQAWLAVTDLLYLMFSNVSTRNLISFTSL